jgi:flagellar basal body-associated protein FliL
MADKAEKKSDAAPAAASKDGAAAGDHKDGAAKKAGGGLMAKTPVLLGIVMVLEAVVLFAGFKFLGGGPKAAAAVDLAHEEAAKDEHGGGDGHGGGHGGGGAAKGANDKNKTVELNVVDFKAPNTQNGRRYIYDVSVFVSVKGEFEPKVKEKIKDRDALIKDRLRTILGQMDPEKLGGGSEPGLETLRRQIKSQLEIIIGDGMIDEVLVPRCIPFRADF